MDKASKRSAATLLCIPATKSSPNSKNDAWKRSTVRIAAGKSCTSAMTHLEALATAIAGHGTPPFPMVLLICSGASFWMDISICKPGASRRSPMRTGAGAIQHPLCWAWGKSEVRPYSYRWEECSRMSALAATAYQSLTTAMSAADGPTPMSVVLDLPGGHRRCHTLYRTGLCIPAA